MPFQVIGEIPQEIDQGQLQTAANETFKMLGDFEANLKFVSEEEIRALNKEYRGKNEPTDVLSFQTEPNVSGGDIALFFEMVKSDAKQWGMGISEATAFILVHSMLHLTGMDHTDEADRVKMEKTEEDILEKINIVIER